MNTQLSYLIEERDFHTSACSCPEPQPLPHFAPVARLYKLDHLSLQALSDLLMINDEGSFDRWLEEQKPQVYYGSTREIARSLAILQAIRQGMLIVNHPEAFPGVSPLINALIGVVGDSYAGIHFPGCLPKEVCECTSEHIRQDLVCRACYARLLGNVLSTYSLKAFRKRESDGQK